MTLIKARMDTVWHVALQVKGNGHRYDIIVFGTADDIDAVERAKALVVERYHQAGLSVSFGGEDAWLEPVVNGAVLVRPTD